MEPTAPASKKPKTKTFCQQHWSECRALYAAISRCHNPKNKAYGNYGARGIIVCDEWRAPNTGPKAFFDHLGERTTPKHSLDRIDNDMGYAPGNVRWATRKEQMQNRRGIIMVEWNGERRALSQLADEHGQKVSLVRSRIRFGMALERALTEPLVKPGILYRGQTRTIKSLAEEHGQTASAVHARIRKGLSIEEAFATAPARLRNNLIAKLAEKYGQKVSTVKNRHRKLGWTLMSALFRRPGEPQHGDIPPSRVWIAQ